jgi:hypothetical protein
MDTDIRVGQTPEAKAHEKDEIHETGFLNRRDAEKKDGHKKRPALTARHENPAALS